MAAAAAAAAPPPVKGYEIEVNLSIFLCLRGAGERGSRLWILEAERGRPRGGDIVWNSCWGVSLSLSRDRPWYCGMSAGGQAGEGLGYLGQFPDPEMLVELNALDCEMPLRILG